MSGPEDRAAARVDQLARRYGLTLEVDRAAVADTYRVVAAYTGPALTAMTADILEALEQDLAVRPEQVSVFVGRDGFPLAEAARGLDPVFVVEHTRTVALSRVVLEQALRDLETHTRRDLGLPAAFRLESAPDPTRPGAYRALTRYLHTAGVPVGIEDSVVALIDTSYKGTSQEMLAAAYPHTDFRGHYAFFGAHPDDPHPGTKTGHALHLDPDPSGGIPTRVTELPRDPALIYTHPDAIAAIEDLHHGPLAKPRAWSDTGPQLRRMRSENAELADLNPVRLADGFADPRTREACHDAALLAVGDVAAAAGAARRSGDPQWRAQLDERAAAFTDQLRIWIAHPDPRSRPGLDDQLGRVLDGFAHRQERDAVHRVEAALTQQNLARGSEPARAIFTELAAAGTGPERDQIVRRVESAPHPELAGGPPLGGNLDATASHRGQLTGGQTERGAHQSQCLGVPWPEHVAGSEPAGQAHSSPRRGLRDVPRGPGRVGARADDAQCSVENRGHTAHEVRPPSAWRVGGELAGQRERVVQHRSWVVPDRLRRPAQAEGGAPPRPSRTHPACGVGIELGDDLGPGTGPYPTLAALGIDLVCELSDLRERRRGHRHVELAPLLAAGMSEQHPFAEIITAAARHDVARSSGRVRSSVALPRGRSARPDPMPPEP